MLLHEARMFEAIVPSGNQLPPYRLSTTQHDGTTTENYNTYCFTPLFRQLHPVRRSLSPHDQPSATGLWGLFVPHLPKATLYKYASRLRWCEGPRCIFHRSNGCFHIQSAFAYTHTVRLRIESTHESAIHRTLFIRFIRLINAMDDSLSLVQVLLTYGVHLVHPGK